MVQSPEGRLDADPVNGASLQAVLLASIGSHPAVGPFTSNVLKRSRWPAPLTVDDAHRSISCAMMGGVLSLRKWGDGEKVRLSRINPVGICFRLVICSEQYSLLSRHCHAFLICVVFLTSLDWTSWIGRKRPHSQLSALGPRILWRRM